MKQIFTIGLIIFFVAWAIMIALGNMMEMWFCLMGLWITLIGRVIVTNDT